MPNAEINGTGYPLMTLHYTVAASQPGSHLFDVTLHLPAATDAPVEIQLPAWIPGSYMIRDYARHVISIAAADADGATVHIDRVGKSGWRLAAGLRDTTVSLRVYGWDLSVRGAHIDLDHAYFNGACLLPEVIGNTAPIRLTVVRPAGLPETAVVATSMQAVDVDASGFGDYSVADYDELLDHPFEIAEQQRISFDAAGIKHEFYLRDAGKFDHARLAADCARICEDHHDLLGTPPDLDRYVFLSYALERGYGGLEHRWSSSLAISRDALPRHNELTDEKAYIILLGLISHEYFHLWNVRRLKPAAFTPMDMTQEVHTSLLWVFEGITSYYDDLGLVRSGVIDRQTYLTLLAKNLTRILRTPGRLTQSLADSSFDAWTKFYKQDENAPNAIISYYAKGALVALALDLTLRSETSTNLDEVMRTCWQRFYLDGAPGMPEDGLEQVVSELAGKDMSTFFDLNIRETKDINIGELLKRFGVDLDLRPMAGFDDLGGPTDAPSHAVYAGIVFDAQQPQRIQSILIDSPAAAAGLSAGDILLAVNGTKSDRSRFDALLKSSRPGDKLEVHAFRGNKLRVVSLILAKPVDDTAHMTIDDDASASAILLQKAWLQ